MADDDIEWPLIIPVDDSEWWDAATDEQREQATSWAVAVLWALTGRVFGTILDRVRPCHRPPSRGTTYDGTLTPRVGFASSGLVSPGVTTTAGGCGCRHDCRHASTKDLLLQGPVDSVVSVTIDGATVDPTAYRIMNRRWLRRVDGQGWPTRQNLDAADDEVGAFVVAYRRGIEPPDVGKLCAGILAVEFLRGLTGGECRLPRGVVSASRNGLTVEMDSRAYFTEGLTGVDEVDQWILSVNPNGLHAPARMVGGRPHLDRVSS